jgi:hypothetical protein
MGVGGQQHAPAALPPGKTRYPLYRRLGVPQGRSGRVRKISPPIRISSPDRPARSESLYRLSYRAPLFCCQTGFSFSQAGYHYPSSQPLVPRIITYTITVKLQINTVDVSCLVSSQQTAVGDRSVVGLSDERPVRVWVGWGQARRHSRYYQLVRGLLV